MKLEYKNNENKYKTVKEVAKNHFHISERLLLRLKRHHQIGVNGKPAEPYFSLNPNDSITFDLSFDEKSENIIPTKMQLDIIYEDDCLLIINKPANLPVHPSIAHFEDSLSNGLQYYFEQNDIHTKIRPVNRLDKDTSRPYHIREKRICAIVPDSPNAKSQFQKILPSYFMWQLRNYVRHD